MSDEHEPNLSEHTPQRNIGHKCPTYFGFAKISGSLKTEKHVFRLPYYH